MSRSQPDHSTEELVDAFSELGPAWARWVHACVPDDAVSHARMRLLNALHCAGDQTMSELASALDVTPRRVTALVDALESDDLVARNQNPIDGRSTIISITGAGERMQKTDWEPHENEIGLAFADLPREQRVQLLRITKRLTEALRQRTAERALRSLE